MNCSDVRDNLPAFLYGDLPAADREMLDKHLTACPACRGELAALQQVRRLLAAVPAPTVTVDLVRLYGEAAQRQASRARRWRRVAVAVGVAAAALVVFALLPALEVRVDAHQIVVRWGAPPAVEMPPMLVQAPTPSPPPAETRPAPAVEEQVQLLSQLIQALATDVQDRDRQQQQELARLQERLQYVQQQTLQQWTATKTQVDALDTAVFVLPRKGPLP
jgi:Putative zinc-finger